MKTLLPSTEEYLNSIVYARLRVCILKDIDLWRKKTLFFIHFSSIATDDQCYVYSTTKYHLLFCSFKNSHKQSASGSFSDSRWSLSQSGLSGIYHSHPFFNDNAVLCLAGKDFLKPHLIAGIIIILHRGQQYINSNVIFVKRAFYCLMYYFYRYTISYGIKRMQILFSVIPCKTLLLQKFYFWRKKYFLRFYSF